MLELKRGGRARVRTEMPKFIALPFLSSKKPSNLVISCRGRAAAAEKCTKKRGARAALLFC